MLLAYPDLIELVNQGVIVGVAPDAISAASIDVRLGCTFLHERDAERGAGLVELDLAERDPMLVKKTKLDIGQTTFLDPGEFVLAQTMEEFNLPNDISATFYLKSSMARCGLNQLSAVWCDAGWNNSVLTLELSNVTKRHRLTLTAGMFVGQMIFHRHTKVPEHMSYSVRGRYNGDKTTRGIKP